MCESAFALPDDPAGILVLRTDYSDDTAWARVRHAVVDADQAEEVYEGWSPFPEGLQEFADAAGEDGVFRGF